MSTWKPEAHTPDDVLHFYDRFDTPYYRVYAGPKPEPAYLRDEYIGQDKNVGREQLQDMLEAIARNPDNTNTYLLQIFSDTPPPLPTKARGKGRPEKQPATKHLTFQLNKMAGYGAMVPGTQVAGMAGPSIEVLRVMMQQQKELLEEMREMKQAQLSTPVSDNEPENKMGAIGEILSNPALQPFIAVASEAIAGWMQKKLNNKPGAQVNGIEVNDVPTLEETMDTLNRAGFTYDDLLRMARFSEKNKFQFNIYLNMLRNVLKNY